MSDIDWSKAPSHATHWCPGNARIEAGWIYQAGGEFYSCYSDRGLEHIPDFPAWRKARLVPRPTAWTGDGLPPVGEVCEASLSHINDGAWTAVEILAHAKHDSDDAVLVREKNRGTMHGIIYDRSWFRPIQTPEQIAEEERKAAIVEIGRLFNEGGPAAIYFAGYRKAGDA